MCHKIICTFELQYLITSFNSQIVLTNIVIQYYVFSLLNFFENFLVSYTESSTILINLIFTTVGENYNFHIIFTVIY